jgi:hypothetical protein
MFQRGQEISVNENNALVVGFHGCLTVRLLVRLWLLVARGRSEEGLKGADERILRDVGRATSRHW